MKKRLFTMFLSFILLVSCMSTAVYAGQKPEPDENRVFDCGINQTMIDALLQIVRNGDESFHGDEIGITTDNFNNIFIYMLYFYPEFAPAKSPYFKYRLSNNTTAILGYGWSYDAYCQSKMSQYLKRIDEAYAEVEALLPADKADWDDLTIAHVVHDYLAATTAYDRDGIASNRWAIYSGLGVFVDHYAVCQGISIAYYYILKHFGVKCAIATSNNKEHGWNLVYLRDKNNPSQGEWYHVDITADDPDRDMLGRVYHDYFLLSTETLLEKDKGREDFVVLTETPDFVFTDETCAKDQTYESGQLWTGSVTCCHYYGGHLYTMKAGSALYEDGKEIYTPSTSGNWSTLGGSITFKESMNRLAPDGSKVYITTPRIIYCYDLEEKSVAKTYDFGLSSSEAIFGLANIEGKLKFTIGTATPTQNENWIDLESYSYQSGTLCKKVSIFTDNYLSWRVDSLGRLTLSYCDDFDPSTRIMLAYYDVQGKMLSLTYLPAGADLKVYGEHEKPVGATTVKICLLNQDFSPFCENANGTF